MALKCHPDKNPDPEAHEQFQQLNKINSVLSCPLKRRDYDQFGEVSDDEISDGDIEEDEIDHAPPTLEEIQAFLEKLGIHADASKLMKNTDFESKMSKATVYTKEILKQTITSAQENEISHLSLYKKSIKALPEEIGNLTLDHLDLSNNTLTSLPSTFSQLVNLTILNLSVNKLSSFPECILSLTKLKSLDLQHNSLPSLPNNISSLENLEELNLFANQLTKLPEELGDLNKLKKVDLELNHLSSLPTGLLSKSKDGSLQLIIDPALEMKLEKKAPQKRITNPKSTSVKKAPAAKKAPVKKAAPKRKRETDVQQKREQPKRQKK
eukprot:TRINITY_DN14212_c0_g1_i1.p1 TRINITY_DN14212_c0_g1~~TRINITY_DN14212_c0_g1_i1.p1  ORF type:complete len:355 (-),score=73.25 TRINITY_DN14212_c0_g1_i1:53-1024(-)